MANQLNEVPSSLEPIAGLELGSKRLEVTVSAVWYKFFVSLAAVLGNLIGGVLGFTTNTGLVAAGATQAAALALTAEWNVVATVPANSGVMLHSFGAGAPGVVFNSGANPLRVYPPVGGRIDALAINAPYVLAASKMQTFNQVDNLSWLSTQLG